MKSPGLNFAKLSSLLGWIFLYLLAVRPAAAVVVMDATFTPHAFLRNEWVLKKDGNFSPNPAGGAGTATWTIVVEKGTPTSGFAVSGYFDLYNIADVPVSLKSVVVDLQTKPGATWTTLSANVADSLLGDAATTAVVDPSLTESGVPVFTENALSGSISLTNSSNAPVNLNPVNSVVIPAGGSIRLYYVSRYNVSLPAGTPIQIGLVASFEAGAPISGASYYWLDNAPAPTVANGTVKLLDNTITPLGSAVLGSFTPINLDLTTGGSFTLTAPVSSGPECASVCNSASLTSPSTILVTLENGATVTIPGIELQKTSCLDVDTAAPVIVPISNITVSTDATSCGVKVPFSTTALDCNLQSVTYSHAPGSEFPLGTTTVTITAKDLAGHTSTSTFTITVNDTLAPVITAPHIQVDAAAGVCNANVSFNATATDCSGYSIIYSLSADFSSPITSGANFPIGTTTVYVKATDSVGNSSTTTFIVTVKDVTAPVIAPIANITANTDASKCVAKVTFTGTATDCSTYTMTFSPASGSDFPVGTTTVTATATDAHGNSSSTTFTVTVVDNQAPTINPISNITTSTDAGKCVAKVTFVATATDCAGAATVTYSHAPGSEFSIGTTVVTVTAKDAAGNTSTTTFTVTVKDTEKPVIAPIANITKAADAGTCTTNVAFELLATDCSAVTIVSSPASGSAFNIGTTTVNVTATDAAGNVSTSSFTVTVTDTQAPVITSPLANFTLQNDAGKCYATFNYTPSATDNCVGTVNMTVSPASGTQFAAGTTTTVTVTATDTAGNSVSKTFTVTVAVCPPPPCIPATIAFNGSTSVYGSVGNIRQYSVNGITVKVSAFSRTKGTTGSWATGYLGVYSGGLGVTDGSEDGSSNTHTVDNVGRDNFVLFEFSQPIVINRAYLGYAPGDSDLSAWVGNIPNAFTNHVTLSDAVLAGLTREQDTTETAGARWAGLNAGQLSGNILVIAGDLTDTSPDDYFKIAALDICAPAAPLSLACVSATTGTVGTAYSSSLVASGGKAPYTYSIVSGALPGGLTLNATTGAITGTPTAAGTFNFTAKVVDSTSGTAQVATVTCSITTNAAPVCVPTKFTFNGSTSVNGTSGNIRQYTVNGISVKVSAFSRSSTGSWSAAYLGAYSGGLGVTDTSEDGSSDSHTTDNVGRDNFVLFEFSQPVVINRAYLGYVVTDSDVTAWVGHIPTAYSNHISLSDGVLNGLSDEESLTDSSSARWAKLNSAGFSGNILIISASVLDDTPDDKFKLAALEICQPSTNPVTLACVSVDTGKVGVSYASSLRAEGGTPGYTFSIVSGSLPPGLTLNPSTGAITGTPTTKGTFTFTAKVVDSKGTTGTNTASQTCCITIAPSTTTPTGKIGSLVWKDLDGDGIQDAGEPGISGVTVVLKNSGGTTIATDVTDSSGVYGFDGLTAGSYSVVVATPSGLTRSPNAVGTNRAIDSNGSPASVTLSTNSSIDLTIDFGFVPPTTSTKPLTTFTQGGWGSSPSGNNPGAFLAKNFSAVYPSGYVAIGTTSKYLAFTSASAVCAFLPQGGTAGTLSGSAVNPTTSSAGVLAGQLLAATLNVDFSSKGRTAPGLGSKRIGSGALKGKTVTEVLAIANAVIAGGSLPSGLTLSKLNDTLTGINENYNDGANDGYLY